MVDAASLAIGEIAAIPARVRRRRTEGEADKDLLPEGHHAKTYPGPLKGARLSLLSGGLSLSRLSDAHLIGDVAGL